MSYDQSQHKNATIRVFDYLYERFGQWVPGYDLCHPDVGGMEGIRRKRYLVREQGFIIEGRQMKGSHAWEYRLMGVREDFEEE